MTLCGAPGLGGAGRKEATVGCWVRTWAPVLAAASTPARAGRESAGVAMLWDGLSADVQHTILRHARRPGPIGADLCLCDDFRYCEHDRALRVAFFESRVCGFQRAGLHAT